MPASDEEVVAAFKAFASWGAGPLVSKPPRAQCSHCSSRSCTLVVTLSMLCRAYAVCITDPRLTE